MGPTRVTSLGSLRVSRFPGQARVSGPVLDRQV
jgi:hypothetical protein